MVTLRYLFAIVRSWFPSPKPKPDDPLLILLREQLSAQQEMMAGVVSSLTALAQSQAEQAKGFQDYLSFFKTDSTPLVSRTIRDEDEYRWEMERNGYPTSGTPEEQAKWVLQQTE